MTDRLVPVVLLLALAAAPAQVSAQGAPGGAPTAAPSPRTTEVPAARPTPVQVQVVVSRYRGDKKTSSVPYALSVKPGAQRGSNLRLQTSVPVATGPVFSPPSTDADAKPGLITYNYRDIGISMDVNAAALDDGRYEVTVVVSESSLSTDTRPLGTLSGNVPTLVRSYASQNVLVLRDGQTSQYTAATDPVSGEVVRIDVTLTVPK